MAGSSAGAPQTTRAREARRNSYRCVERGVHGEVRLEGLPANGTLRLHHGHRSGEPQRKRFTLPRVLKSCRIVQLRSLPPIIDLNHKVLEKILAERSFIRSPYERGEAFFAPLREIRQGHVHAAQMKPGRRNISEAQLPRPGRIDRRDRGSRIDLEEHGTASVHARREKKQMVEKGRGNLSRVASKGKLHRLRRLTGAPAPVCA